MSVLKKTMELSVIIPVYRETAGISRTLETLLNLSIPVPHEILVVDGEPGASTLAYLTDREIADERIRPIISPKGRGTQLNTGAKASRGRLLFFLHADTCPNQQGVDAMLEAWQTSIPSRFCGAFDLTIDSPRPWFRIIERTASLRSRLTRIPYGDQGIFMSRILFERIGGFPDVPLMEDVGLMAAVKHLRIRPLFLTHTIRTSARRWESEGAAYTTLRNWTLITLYACGVPPEKLIGWY
ncbi:MAG: TIGR04283 family arsenosugar biosynthesis glycosyltransferase [Desulfobacterales bacterium]|nr:TIGR04283 family arsenosugar biosynthesis glycosyltransferase [Desulfobacterales bacterium]